MSLKIVKISDREDNPSKLISVKILGKVTNIEYGKIDFENVNIETVTST